MTADINPTPVRLPARSRQGIVMGLDGWQLTLVALAGLALLIGINRFGPPGLLFAAPIYLPLFALAVTTIHGISAPRLGGLWLMKKLRSSVGATRQVYRPEQTQLEGTVNLPGTRASVQFWSVDGICAVYDPAAKTVSITAELEIPGFMMKDIAERSELSQHWARVLATFTQRPGVKRVSVQERTTPGTIREARENYAAAVSRSRVSVPSSVTANYQAVMDHSESYAVAHLNYITVTFDLVEMGPQLKALKGGKQAIQALAAVEAGNITGLLRSSQFRVRRWLGTRDVAAMARTAFDPDSLASIQNRGADSAGVDLAAIGPMYFEEPSNRHGVVLTESAVHTTMWIHEWPRSDASVGFVSPVVFARNPVTDEAISHIFTTVLTPVPVRSALKRIRDEKRVWRGNERLRAKRGSDGSAADVADWEALERQEEEIVAGHGEYRFGAYLTVTAPDEEALDQAMAGMRNALAQAGMEGQVLYCQQAEALLVNALPIGRGMK